MDDKSREVHLDAAARYIASHSTLEYWQAHKIVSVASGSVEAITTDQILELLAVFTSGEVFDIIAMGNFYERLNEVRNDSI